MPDLRQRFLREILANPHNREILERWDALALPDGWLVAGCLFQTAWNLREGRDPTAGIKDYDLFYFDAGDLSPGAEERVQARADAVLAGLGIEVEAKNQARVHLWYPEYFGKPYAALTSSADGIARFLVPCTCVGVRPGASGLELHAPYGLELLYEGILAPNPLIDHRELFLRKAQSYRTRWPWLTIRTE